MLVLDQELKLSCDKCSEEFPSQSELRRHIQEISTIQHELNDAVMCSLQQVFEININMKVTGPHTPAYSRFP